MRHHRIEIGKCHGVGAKLKIQSAQLHPHLRQVGLDDEHTFKGGDSAFQIAYRNREFGKTESLIKIANIFIHLKKRGVVLLVDRKFLRVGDRNRAQKRTKKCGQNGTGSPPKSCQTVKTGAAENTHSRHFMQLYGLPPRVIRPSDNEGLKPPIWRDRFWPSVLGLPWCDAVSDPLH